MPRHRTRALWALLAIGAVAVALVGCSADAGPVVTHTPTPVASTAAPLVDKPKAFFNKSQYSIDDPTSIWVVVNKLRPLQPANYAPKLVTLNVPHISAPLMTQEAGDALLKMFAASAAEGGGALQVQNSYRSFAVQTNTHNSLVATLGQAKADAQSARPGYSEHQTGLALDVAALPSKCDIAACFGQTPRASGWRRTRGGSATSC